MEREIDVYFFDEEKAFAYRFDVDFVPNVGDFVKFNNICFKVCKKEWNYEQERIALKIHMRR